MSDQMVQQLKERMYRDQAFRHQLIVSPLQTLREYDLTEDEQQQFIVPNFSWLIENKLAGVSYPRSEDAIALLKKLGVKALLSLHEEPLPTDLLTRYEFQMEQLRVPDFTAPTLSQIERAIAIIDGFLAQGLPVAVHCGAGLGRTGTALACYLISQGSSAQDAIEQVRTKRPSSIETPEQVAVIELYERHRKEQVPKPAHLTTANAARFQEQSVVDRYTFRLTYPAETFDILVGLITDEPHTVLDVGTGTGDLARQLVARVERVDAVDWSAAMIQKGKTLSQGNHPRLNWITGQIEHVQLHPPYALITAGESLHWMDWEVVLPRFHDVATPHGQLAIVHREEVPPPWQDGLSQLIQRYSTMHNYQSFDLIEELEKRHLFQKTGESKTTPVTSTLAIEHYIASFHSRSSLSLEHMPPIDAVAFDTGLRKLIEPWCDEDHLQLQCIGSVVWGTPQNPEKG